MQCQQLVTIESCCDPQQCPQLATMQHAVASAALCAEHYGNAVKYSIDNTWHVGRRAVPFPDGWTSIEAAEESSAAAGLVGVVPASVGLIVEPASGSGLVLG